MAAPKQRVSVPIQVSLREETLTRLTASNPTVSPSESLSSRCSQFLELLADGGLALTPDQVAEVEKNFGKTIRGGPDVVRATEPRAGKLEGDLAYTFTIDPQWQVPLEERARESGRSVADLLREMNEIALENNWVFGLSYEGTRHTFPPAEQRFFAEALGENFTIRDLASSYRELLRQSKKAGKKAETEMVEVG
jgi:hypothetical protein